MIGPQKHPLLQADTYLSPACQFRTTVKKEVVSPPVDRATRKRWPSRVGAYVRLTEVPGIENRAFGMPGSSVVAPMRRGTAISFRSAAR